MFSSKNGWGKVINIQDLPVTYRDGYMFVSYRDSMCWGV